MAGRSLAFLTSIPVDQVKGIGAQTKKKLNKAGIESVTDLLLHVPRRYLDRSQLFDLSAVPLDEEVTGGGTAINVTQRRISKGRLMTTAVVSDGTNVIKCTWFRKYMKLLEGSEVVLSGKVERFRGALQMTNPDWDYWHTDEALLQPSLIT